MSDVLSMVGQRNCEKCKRCNRKSYLYDATGSCPSAVSIFTAVARNRHRNAYARRRPTGGGRTRRPPYWSQRYAPDQARPCPRPCAPPTYPQLRKRPNTPGHLPANISCARTTQKSGLFATGIAKNCWLFSAQICSSIGRLIRS